MGNESNGRPSLRPPRHDPGDEAWKTAPSRESTHDDPDGKDQRIERHRKPLENAPGNVPTAPDGDEGDHA